MKDCAIKPQDEEVHPVGEGEHWQESWYFNWADPRHDVFGLARIGFRFRQRQIDGLVLTIRRGKPEYVYPAVNIRYRGSWSDQTGTGGFHAHGLAFRIQEPLKRWRLSLKGRDAMELDWSAFTPVYNYHESGGDLPPNVAGHHFEQSGYVTGWTRFKGQELEMDGSGQRDKSWGVRDWASVEGWNWISAQFGEDLSFNVWEGFFGGKRYQNGFVFRDGNNHPIDELAIRFRWGRREHLRLESHLEIVDTSGTRLEVTAEALGQFPLLKKGLWIQETHASFSARQDGKSLSGIGVIEHAWRPGRLGTFARVPEILGTAARVLRR
jgi:hypothetical protein